jgi:hypothetical protein
MSSKSLTVLPRVQRESTREPVDSGREPFGTAQTCPDNGSRPASSPRPAAAILSPNRRHGLEPFPDRLGRLPPHKLSARKLILY